MDQFFIIALFLTMVLVHTGPTTKSPCCYQKTVGEVSYTLKETADTSGYGCESDCVYQIDEQPSSNICFKRGDLIVKCDDGFEGENVIANPFKGHRYTGEQAGTSKSTFDDYTACIVYCNAVDNAKYFVYGPTGDGTFVCTCLSTKQFDNRVEDFYSGPLPPNEFNTRYSGNVLGSFPELDYQDCTLKCSGINNAKFFVFDQTSMSCDCLSTKTSFNPSIDFVSGPVNHQGTRYIGTDAGKVADQINEIRCIIACTGVQRAEFYVFGPSNEGRQPFPCICLVNVKSIRDEDGFVSGGVL